MERRLFLMAISSLHKDYFKRQRQRKCGNIAYQVARKIKSEYDGILLEALQEKVN